MPNEITAFAPNWVNDKLEMVFSKNFQRIIEFYVFSTPCSLVSSSVTGMNNHRRTWEINLGIILNSSIIFSERLN